MPRRSATRITETTVKRKPRAKPIEIRDCDLRGFLLRIEPSGTRTFYCEWGRGQRSRIGDAALMTVTEARETAEQRIAGAKRGEIPKPQIRNRTLTLREFVDGDYRTFAVSHQKAGASNVQRLIGAFPSLLPQPLDRIISWSLDQWKAERRRAGRKPATINRDLSMLRACLNKAAEWGLIDSNPVSAVKPLKADEDNRVRYLTPEEEKRLLAALDAREAEMRKERVSANRWRRIRGYDPLPEFGDGDFTDHLRPMCIIAKNTGLRFSELSRLTWSDVTMGPNPLITIRAAHSKTRKSRSIPLNQTALAVLKAWKRQRGEAEGYVFTNHRGHRIRKLRTSWTSLLKRAEITNFRWHDLRHDFASKLVMAGQDLNTVRELLGHGSIDMTLRYAHLAPRKLAAAVAAIDAPAASPPAAKLGVAG